MRLIALTFLAFIGISNAMEQKIDIDREKKEAISKVTKKLLAKNKIKFPEHSPNFESFTDYLAVCLTRQDFSDIKSFKEAARLRAFEESNLCGAVFQMRRKPSVEKEDNRPKESINQDCELVRSLSDGGNKHKKSSSMSIKGFSIPKKKDTERDKKTQDTSIQFELEL